jgi:hypothetical protein
MSAAVSLQRVLEELEDLLGDAFVHLLRQIEPVVQAVHVVQQELELSDQVVGVLELPPDQPLPNLRPVARTQEPQDVEEGIPDLLDEVEPIGPLRRDVQEIGPDLRDLAVSRGSLSQPSK